jgi:hypothetical protein
MVDYAHPQRPTERISDRERDGAIAELNRAREEGRLRPAEFDERANTARAATTWGDIAPLFADLPRSSGSGSGHPEARGEYWGSGSRALGGPIGATIMAFVPFVALGLFFIGGFVWGGWAWAWLFFLLIPIAGIIIYGPASQYRDRR